MAIKNLTSLFPLIFLSKHISLYALGRLKWILDIIWPLNQHFNLKNQRNWGTTFLMLRVLIGIICILMHRPKKLTLVAKPATYIYIWAKVTLKEAWASMSRSLFDSLTTFFSWQESKYCWLLQTVSNLEFTFQLKQREGSFKKNSLYL